MSGYVEWVCEGQLARASRPGYGSANVSLEDTRSWMDQVKEMGVRSIICLLNGKQLNYYRSIPGGLLDYYREEGFNVVNIPITDPAHDPAGEEELEAALDEICDTYERLEKPVLIHCSAGVDRTGRAVSEIKRRGLLERRAG